jgi:hypothetical protein
MSTDTSTATADTTATATDTSTASTTAADQQATQQQTTTAANDQQTTTKASEGKVEDLPDWAQRIIRETRQEAAGNRTKATEAETKQQQTLDAIAVALGFKKGDETPAPEVLARQLADSQNDGKAAKVELAVFKAAATAGADPVALTDSRSFMTKVSDLDPTAKDFADKVKAEIETAIKDNPKLKTVQVAASSSADHAGGSGEGAVTAEQFKKMNGAQRNELARSNPTLYNQLAGRS